MAAMNQPEKKLTKRTSVQWYVESRLLYSFRFHLNVLEILLPDAKTMCPVVVNAQDGRSRRCLSIQFKTQDFVHNL